MKVIPYAQLKPVKGITYSKRHLMRLVLAGKFPAPLELGDGRVAWIDSEIDEHLQSLPRAWGTPRAPEAT
jgi:predicted DNA-binding transcriptional regulator AlpA